MRKAHDQERSDCMVLKSSILTAKRLMVTLRVKFMVPLGDNQGLCPCMLFSKSSNQNQIILTLYFFKTKGIITSVVRT